MKIATLLENNRINDTFNKKHGLSFYIETTKHKILFDLGPDDSFIENARNLGVAIGSVDTVVISHGHYDHGGGLKEFLAHNQKAKIYIHKKAFEPHYTKMAFVKYNIGLDRNLLSSGRIVLVDSVLEIDDELLIFSDVEPLFKMPPTNRNLLAEVNGKLQRDTFSHEQSLIVRENGKNVLFGGCAHRGVINIIRAAERHVGKIDAVFSGFHLYSPSRRQAAPAEYIDSVASELLKRDTKYYTCHCTGEKPFIHLRRKMRGQIQYVASGSTLEI